MSFPFALQEHTYHFSADRGVRQKIWVSSSFPNKSLYRFTCNPSNIFWQHMIPSRITHYVVCTKQQGKKMSLGSFVRSLMNCCWMESKYSRCPAIIYNTDFCEQIAKYKPMATKSISFIVATWMQKPIMTRATFNFSWTYSYKTQL